jgi:hypothetical protein
VPDLCISTGNNKIGRCLNISLPPEQTCKGRACNRDCYARKGQCAGPTAKAAWAKNWEVLQTDWIGYFREIQHRIYRSRSTRFRWHVGGDIPNSNYLWSMYDTAQEFPEVSFTTYTKSWYTDRHIQAILEKPHGLRNLRIFLSVWPDVGYKGVPVGFPWPLGLHGTFWVTDSAPNGRALHCPGHCPSCLACWNSKPGKVIWIKRH